MKYYIKNYCIMRYAYLNIDFLYTFCIAQNKYCVLIFFYIIMMLFISNNDKYIKTQRQVGP